MNLAALKRRQLEAHRQDLARALVDEHGPARDLARLRGRLNATTLGRHLLGRLWRDPGRVPAVELAVAAELLGVHEGEVETWAQLARRLRAALEGGA